MLLPQFDTAEDCLPPMDARTAFYKHPYASMVTAVFLFALLLTVVSFAGLIPGLGKTQPEFDTLILITVVLLGATAASWFTAIVLRADDR